MLAPADIEFVLVEYLKSRLTVPVATKLGSAKNQVVLFTTGGSKSTLVSGRPRVVFDCYGEREALAINLANQAWALVEDLDCRMIGGTQFYDVDSTLPINLPHPDKPDLFRRQFNSLIHTRHVRVS